MSAKTDISRMPSQRSSQSVDYVGFSNFPNQVFRRCIKNGFEFTIMVVGQSGLGKSTLLNSLFLSEVHDIDKEPTEIVSTVNIETKTMKMVENDVRLTITFVDTPGFGDLVNNSNCWDPIVKYIDDKFTDYLNQETKVDRPAIIPDNRVHLCLYFIAPTGHRLKPLDIECMQALQKRVNIVPVIAKADTMTATELAKFKKNVLEDIAQHKIGLYLFPGQEKQDEPLGLVEERKSQLANANGSVASVADLLKRIPFAVVGSNNVKEGDRRRLLRVREYPWGVVEVDNMAHNDFVALRDLIIRNHMIDLIDMTKVVHYENFRIRQMGSNSKNTENDPFTQLEQERKTNEATALEMRQAKERLFVEHVASREKILLEKAQTLDEMEKKYEQALKEKKAILNRLAEELNDLRQGKNNSALTDSGSSLNSERTKKKGTLGLFGR